MDLIKEGNSVLYLWDGEFNANIEANVNEINNLKNISLNVENLQRITMGNSLLATKFDVIITKNTKYTKDVLALLLKFLKPSGKLTTVLSESNLDEVKENLILSGFVNIRQGANNELICEKPNYEVGSSSKLSFAKKPDKTSVAAVWKIDNDDDEIINPDDLLDEEDKVKPDPSSLRVCGTTGKRKACKDCSCGLAKELSGETSKQDIPVQKSSCGSCYLGDAFRCASCPYLGMPAFKPGEKIQLNDNLLKADA